MAVQWSESLSVGVAAIDDQHKELINTINKLFDACSQGKGRQEVANVIGFLGDYVVKHFGDEEKLQQKYGYPAFRDHKQQHEKFIKDFSELKKQFETEGATIKSVTLVNRVIVDWLVKHISNSDKAVGNFIKTKAI